MVRGERHHIILIGEMGAGKTTLGSALAEALGRPFLDSDEYLVTDGRSGAEIAAESGIPYLHARELGALRAMIGSPEPAVIAPAASVVDSQAGRSLLRRFATVWLDAVDSVLEARIEQGHHRRATTLEERAGLREQRESHLAEIAAFRVDTSSGEPSDLVDAILRRLSVFEGLEAPTSEVD